MSGDRYKYFRIEARDLVEGLTRGVLDLEKGSAEPDLLSRVFRYAHTLKGAARIVQQARIAALSHSMEEVLAAIREKPEALAPDKTRQLLGLIDEISAELAQLGEPTAAKAAAPVPTAAPPRAAAQTGDEQLESVRVDMKEMDALLQSISELRVQMTGLSRLTQEFQGAAQLVSGLVAAGADGPLEPLEATLQAIQRKVSHILGRSVRELETLHEQAEAMRLVPANSLFGVLERTARDAAEQTNKQVAFEAAGGETRLDARVLKLLRNALIQLVRNAISHGIESPAARVQAGKPAVGRVEIRVERHGSRAEFVCQDDGQGVNIERVRQVLQERGLARPGEAETLSGERAMDALLRGGISTAQSVSQLSGRGVGLDVVRQAAALLNGSISGTTEVGKGTRIGLSVPVTIESQEVLHVQVGRTAVSIPLQAVRKTQRVSPREIALSPEGPTVLLDGQTLRFAPLAQLLADLDGASTPGDDVSGGAAGWSALILDSSAGVAAVGVTRILGRERVVIRPLPSMLSPVATVSGAFLNSEGDPQLVMSVEGLVAAAWSAAALPPRPTAAPPRLLVIDDSLTTRMLEQGILETAGYRVDTAASGEEALERIRQQPYAAFIVDVEMPGMNGFDFIQRTRAEPELSSIPAIVVTSRASAEDRARGAAVGAKAYIVKGEFDEKVLLNAIRKLVG